jgi:hypothetical protein
MTGDLYGPTSVHPAWCRHHVTGRAGVQLHVHQVGALVRIAQEDAGGPAVELVWPGRDDGRELPADPGMLEEVARQLAAAAAILRTS